MVLLAVLVGALVGGYTLVVGLGSPGALIGWFSTLVSTAASVWAALLIGLVPFQHQTQETDRKKKEALTELLKTELSEVRGMLERSWTVVPDEALETTESSFTAHKMEVSIHFTHPLIVEEAARRGLFDTEQTAEMLHLARKMEHYNVLLQEVMTWRLYEESTRSASDTPFSSKYLLAMKHYAEAARSVQRSEERIVNGCTALLETLPYLLRSAQSA
jgi:hypothetical protein